MNVTLAYDDDDMSWDAGLHKASLGNFVWEDVNIDGDQDAGETGILGVTVELYASDKTTLLKTETTDASGNYLFNDLNAGDYYVKFTSPAGYLITDKKNVAGASDAVNSDAGINGLGVAEYFTDLITLTDGEAKDTVDAGFYQPSTLGNYVWNDVDTDGVQDAGEAAVQNATVVLYKTSDYPTTALNTTTTDVNGNYLFTNLRAGNYVVEVIKPAGSTFAFTTSDQGGNDATDSDVSYDAVNDKYKMDVTLPYNFDDNRWDAGLHKASLGNFVWEDVNIDGDQDAGETGILGVTVELYASDKTTLLKTETTDASGNYLFNDLNAGDYYVKFTSPAGYLITDKNVAGASDAVNSDAGINGLGVAEYFTDLITLTDGEAKDTVDAGFYQPSTLGNYVWNDVDTNGVQDTGEAAVQNATVVLYKTSDYPTTVLNTTTTDVNGNYLFTNLRAGNYVVEVIKPAGSTFAFTTSDQGGNDATDSDVSYDAVNDKYKMDVTLPYNFDDNRWDAGLHEAILGDYVWEDTDVDGVQDAGEPAMQGVTVNLYTVNGLGTRTFKETTTTDVSGKYLFTNLAVGNYVVEFEQQVGYVLTDNGAGNDSGSANDSDVNSDYFTDTIEISGGEKELNVDAGYFKPATVGNYVWNDINVDGLQQGGSETGISNAKVTLYDSAMSEVSNMFTNASGYYEFTGLKPGNYYIKVERPTGSTYTMSVQDTNGNGNDSSDSDINPGTNITNVFDLAYNETDNSIDAGFHKASLGDFVWEDENVNGTQDTGESVLSGVEVTLYSIDGSGTKTLKGKTTTDIAGKYLFSDLDAGRYVVEFGQITGYILTDNGTGNDSGSSDDSDVNSDYFTDTIVLSDGEQERDVDAGYFKPSSISNFVWNDLNTDGLQTAGEPGIINAKVTLYDDKKY